MQHSLREYRSRHFEMYTDVSKAVVYPWHFATILSRGEPPHLQPIWFLVLPLPIAWQASPFPPRPAQCPPATGSVEQHPLWFSFPRGPRGPRGRPWQDLWRPRPWSRPSRPCSWLKWLRSSESSNLWLDLCAAVENFCFPHIRRSSRCNLQRGLLPFLLDVCSRSAARCKDKPLSSTCLREEMEEEYNKNKAKLRKARKPIAQMATTSSPHSTPESPDLADSNNIDSFAVNAQSNGVRPQLGTSATSLHNKWLQLNKLKNGISPFSGSHEHKTCIYIDRQHMYTNVYMLTEREREGGRIRIYVLYKYIYI